MKLDINKKYYIPCGQHYELYKTAKQHIKMFHIVKTIKTKLVGNRIRLDRIEYCKLNKCLCK